MAVGWILARIHKGTRFMIGADAGEQDEVWLPQLFDFEVDAEVALSQGLQNGRRRKSQSLQEVPHLVEDRGNGQNCFQEQR